MQLRDFEASWTQIDEGIRKKHHIGGQMYVWHDGVVKLDAAFGECSPGRPMTPDHWTLWFSSVKPLTAIGFAQLWESGRVEVKEPVSNLIPEFGVNGKQSVTWAHILTHTAGFRSADQMHEILPWAETVQEVCAAPLEMGWEPGRKAGYQTGSSWILLAESISRITGRPVTHHLRQHVLLPFQMENTQIGLPKNLVDDNPEWVAPVYRTDRGSVEPHSFWNSGVGKEIFRPGSNGRGPIHDLGRFYTGLLQILHEEPDAPTVLSHRTLREMISRQREGLFDYTFMHKIDFGLGFVLNSNRYGVGTVPYGYGRHSSERSFGHSGVQTSCGFADPEHRLVVTWVFNGMAGERIHQQRARELNSRIYEDLGLA